MVRVASASRAARPGALAHCGAVDSVRRVCYPPGGALPKEGAVRNTQKKAKPAAKKPTVKDLKVKDGAKVKGGTIRRRAT